MDWLDDQRRQQKAAADAYIAEHPHIDSDAIQLAGSLARRAASRARLALHRQVVLLQKQRDEISNDIIKHTKMIDELAEQIRQTDELIADYRLAIEKLETK